MERCMTSAPGTGVGYKKMRRFLKESGDYWAAGSFGQFNMYHPVSFLGDYRTLWPISELTIFCPLPTIDPRIDSQRVNADPDHTIRI
jgi:hypothetical protein